MGRGNRSSNSNSGSIARPGVFDLDRRLFGNRREAGPGQSKKPQKKINPTAGVVWTAIRTHWMLYTVGSRNVSSAGGGWVV